jgi:hypothetical protein
VASSPYTQIRAGNVYGMASQPTWDPSNGDAHHRIPSECIRRAREVYTPSTGSHTPPGKKAIPVYWR